MPFLSKKLQIHDALLLTTTAATEGIGKQYKEGPNKSHLLITCLGTHTCKNLIPMVVTRAMANSSKNHVLLMCRIWKMGWIFFHHWTSEKIPFLYFFLHKSWIWQTLGHVTKKISYCHFHNASKEYFWPKKILNFMHRFKSAILAICQFLPNWHF